MQKQADGRPLAQGRWCQSGDVRERPQVARWGSSSGCCRDSLQRREGGGGAAVCSRQPDRQRLRQAAPPPPRIATPAARHPPPWAAQGRGARGHTVAAAKNCSTDAPNRPPARRRRLAAPPPLSTRVMTAGHDRPDAQRTTPVTVGVRVRRAPPIRQPGRPLPPRVVREGGGRRHAACGGGGPATRSLRTRPIGVGALADRRPLARGRHGRESPSACTERPAIVWRPRLRTTARGATRSTRGGGAALTWPRAWARRLARQHPLSTQTATLPRPRRLLGAASWRPTTHDCGPHIHPMWRRSVGIGSGVGGARPTALGLPARVSGGSGVLSGLSRGVDGGPLSCSNTDASVDGSLLARAPRLCRGARRHCGLEGPCRSRPGWEPSGSTT